MSAKYVIGVDLGTTNSVLAYVPIDAEEPQPEVLKIAQLVAPGTVEEKASLASYVYLSSDDEAADGALALPWDRAPKCVVGEYARRQAADVPQRTVSGAKSWLCHSRVDRRQPILPWNAPADVAKISPVQASRRILEHLIAAWQHAFPDAPFARQRVVLTVPASFDAAARELTREAALESGFPPDFLLLEEPQAALYAWLADTGAKWRKVLRVEDQVLVCDVGGGTTDLTLVGVAEESGELTLRRLAVGNHLLVGGDNMDLALAHMAARLFAEKGTSLDAWQSVSLWHACRQAKEALLADDGPAEFPITILGRGSKLIGGTISVKVNREEVAAALLEGFFPLCEVSERPAKRRASGFREIGLPYETDTAVTRHLAAFLQSHGPQEGRPARPTQLLLNGGVFRAPRLRQRILEVLRSWFPDDPQPRMLAGKQDLDHAVAKGAAYYAWAKEHGGVRIRGGTARAYYVGVETSGPTVPGIPRPLRALCVVPIGMEEGSAVDVPSEEVGLIVGEPVQFRFFGSSIRKNDRPGDVLDRWSPDELEETDSLEACLPAEEGSEGEYVPVRFHAKVTELGMLELWCNSLNSDKKWKLEFSVRDADED
ncbi:MAG: Hsp70 family protein [Thermogutta sp.]|nr:Hsp70 family protein [Thermogutta sp.]